MCHERSVKEGNDKFSLRSSFNYYHLPRILLKRFYCAISPCQDQINCSAKIHGHEFIAAMGRYQKKSWSRFPFENDLRDPG
jgi:hypothetical protein